MAYVTPKTDWDENYEPSPEDMNRIEGNTKQNHDDIVSEGSTRAAADTVLQNNIDTLEEASLLTTTTLDFSGTSSTFASGTNGANIILPRGMYNIKLGYNVASVGNFTQHFIQMYINSAWNPASLELDTNADFTRQIYSDGTNVRIYSSVTGSGGTATTYYTKLA